VAVLSLDRPAPARYVETSVYSEPVAGPGDGAPVHNLYPYTRDGELLFDVLLFGFDPGTKVVSRPAGGPPVIVPHIVTAALDRPKGE
jgi:hypothetical protein